MSGRSKATGSRLEALIRAGQPLVSADEPAELVAGVLESLLELLGAEACGVGRLEPEAEELVFCLLAGSGALEQFRLPLGKGIAGWVASKGEPVLSNDVSADPRFFAGVDRRTGFETRALICAPLIHDGRVTGVVEVINSRSAAGFDSEDLELLCAFAGLLAASLERARVFSAMRKAHTALALDEADRHRLVVGRSKAMREVVTQAKRAAPSPATVLLLGESGTGKEVMAHAIHRWSDRAGQPFLATNCGALSPELLESELFGHEKGAFTGATATKRGRLELADGGTLFLDEIGEMAPAVQVKLLRVLQEREFSRVGGTSEIRADVRVIAATNRDLREAMRNGDFREDLYYRINVVSLDLPPLRERPEDLESLAGELLESLCREMKRSPMRFTPETLERFQMYAWPGNVRELRNVIERAVVLAPGPEIGVADLSPELRRGASTPGDGAVGDIEPGMPLADAVDAFKRRYIERALEAAGGNQTRAASALGLRQPNLSRMLKSLGVR